MKDGTETRDPDKSPRDLAIDIHGMNLHLYELTRKIENLESAAQQTASKADLFRGGLALMLVFLVCGASILYKIDNIGHGDLFLVGSESRLAPIDAAGASEQLWQGEF